MDEIFKKMQQMLGEAFEQGMAFQRMQDAQEEFEEGGSNVSRIWHEIREELAPKEKKDVN